MTWILILIALNGDIWDIRSVGVFKGEYLCQNAAFVLNDKAFYTELSHPGGATFPKLVCVKSKDKS